MVKYRFVLLQPLFDLEDGASTVATAPKQSAGVSLWAAIKATAASVRFKLGIVMVLL